MSDQDGPLVTVDGPTRKKAIGRKGCEVIEDMARNGDTDTSISKRLRLNRETFRFCRQRQPEVQEALDRGRAGFEDEMKDILVEAARDPKNPKQVTAVIFLLKGRCGWREVGEHPGTVVNASTVTINMPGQLSAEAFRELTGGGGDDHESG